ncbi:PAS domain S-box-containing protein [Kaistia soli DSM 19436]|uniref:histidine kinase n=2 Tax=Kaistia TaxID=166953 RepID=A0A1M5E824_9HYPH|nr:PAS domain S-box-containing protein [Kaistia soli DSM 19436]
MSAIMRAHDWSNTPLGPPENWPEGLKVPLRMMLTSRFEMWLGWGPDLCFFYNDAYVPTLGVKHPKALGRPMAEVWREVYDAVEDRIVSVMQAGVATWDKALLLLLERSGYPEETYHTFSYSPLFGDSGAVEGLMCVVTEETERIISERRIEALHHLSSALLSCQTRESVLSVAERALARSDRDFPFVVMQALNDGVALSSGTDGSLGAVRWPVGDLAPGCEWLQVPLEGLVEAVPTGPWDVPPREALIVPVSIAGRPSPVAALILGQNPYRHVDAGTIAFAQLLAGQVAGALATIETRDREAAEIGRLRQLFEQSPSFMAILRGPRHRFELVNPRYRQIVGHREVTGREVAEALPEVVGQGFIDLLDRVYTSGEPFVGQSVPISLDKPGAAPEPRFLDFVYQPIRDNDGVVSGIFVEGIDVTAAHDAAAALRDSEAQFRTLAEAMPNHVWTTRADGMLDWCNTRTYEYSGAEAGSFDGPGWIDLVHPDDRLETTRRFSAALKSGAVYENEFRLRRADGAYRWYIARGVPLIGEDGTIARWIGTNTDIHEQKANAEALAELNQTLEQQVSQRTGELMAAEEALRQSQKMEAVGQLTGGIAHDFNNLLAGISGSLQLLEKRIGQGRFDSIQRYLDAAQSSSKRAAALTQRLLAFSRRQTLDPKPTNINRLVADLDELIRRTMGPSVDMEVVGAGGIWLTLVDPNQLENALLNLCINARDAMPHGGRLTVETANKWLDDRAARDRDLPPGQYVSLSVSDTGTGMTPDVMARAFDPFFTTKPLGEGTGLGLSMIYGFVRQSGGQVRIYSEVGHGSTMTLYLPRYVGEAEDTCADHATRGHEYSAHGETVLIVDDESIVRMLVVDVLREAGYLVLEAADGPSGLKVMQSAARIDLLVTDVGLPGGMNGRQMADAGRLLRPDLKVLFVTGYAENAVVGNGHLEPGMQVITKPFAVEALGNKVREMIDG